MFDGAQVEFHKHFKLNLPVVYRDSDEGDLNDIKTNKYRDWETDRKSTRLNSSHSAKSRMPSSA